MKILEIHQHEALGDHVICNGLTREIITKYRKQEFNKFFIWTKEWLYPAVKFMYRDIADAVVISRDTPKNFNSDLSLTIDLSRGEAALNGKNIDPKTVTWDAWFYAGHDIPFETRWSSFFCSRNLKREKNFYLKMNPDNEKYIIIHSKMNLVNPANLRKDLKYIYINEGNTDNAFDYLTLLDRAEEIHVCDSGIKHIVESFPNIGKKLFYHNNPARNAHAPHVYKRDWILV